MSEHEGSRPVSRHVVPAIVELVHEQRIGVTKRRRCKVCPTRPNDATVGVAQQIDEWVRWSA